MYIAVYLAVLALAVGSSLLAMRSSVDWLTRLLGAGMAMVTWGVWGLQSYEVRSAYTGSAESYQSLAALGFVAALIMALFVVRFALAALRDDPAQGIEPDTALDYSDR
jgi:hypothetical protein